MEILQKYKALLENDVATRKNPDYSLGVYLTAAKEAQYRLIDDNNREKDEAKKTQKKTAV